MSRSIGILFLLAAVALASVGCGTGTPGDNARDVGIKPGLDAQDVINVGVDASGGNAWDASNVIHLDAGFVDAGLLVAPDGSASPADADVAVRPDAASTGLDASGPQTFGSACSGASTVLSGVALAPNGLDLLPNVRAYVPQQVNPFPAVYCDSCLSPIDPALVATTSDATGKFSLTLDTLPLSPSVTFALQIGRFRKVTSVAVTACQTNVVPIAAATLPGNTAAGDIPKIAVSSGTQDHLDAILSALGITEYDCYEGRKTPGASTPTCAQVAGKNIADVLQNPTTLNGYHMLLISCAPGAYANYSSNHNMATITSNTVAWVSAGGRMFATDTAYDYIEQAFPDAITFKGATAASGVAQPVDGANLGCSPGKTTSFAVDVTDPTLVQWLHAVGVSSAPSVSIQGFIQPWSAIGSLPISTRLLASGSFSLLPSVGSTTCGSSQNVPLTATFETGTCGRVAYSSYHTLSTVSAGSLSAQEKIMEYLMFNVAVCSRCPPTESCFY